MNRLESVAIVGAGAVGGYFGAMLARGGAAVTLVARPAQAEAIRRSGLVVLEPQGEWRADVRATPDPADVRDADLLLVAVKSHHTESAVAPLAPHLRRDACVLSLQNGVDNAERIAAILPNPVYAAVVYVGTDTDGPGRIRHTGRGDLLIGRPRNLPARGDAAADLARIARRFEDAHVPCPVSEDIDAALWSKLALNCALNPVSALTQARYRAMAAQADIRELMERLVREAVAVAAAEGIALDAQALVAGMWKLMAAMPEQQSSTAQDLQQGRPTEIDSLNGFVARRAQVHGIDASVNRALHALVKMREATSPRP